MRPALVLVSDSSCRVAVLIGGPVQEPVMGFSADPRPNHLDAGFIGLPRPACSLAVLYLVLAGSIQTQRAPLDPCDHSGPFLRSLRLEHVARREVVLIPDLAVSVLARVVASAGQTSSRRRRLRPVILLDPT